MALTLESPWIPVTFDWLMRCLSSTFAIYLKVLVFIIFFGERNYMLLNCLVGCWATSPPKFRRFDLSFGVVSPVEVSAPVSDN